MAVRKPPLFYLDALAYGRRVFGSDEARWFETPALLGTYRQVLQGLRPDWLLFPALEWAAAWWQANGPDDSTGRPLRTLKARLAHAGLRAALLDALRALHSVTGSGTGLGLAIDGPEQWLAWAGSDEAEVDEGDAEDVVVYLAAALHMMASSGIGAVILRQNTLTQADPDERYAALTNAAGHHAWPTLLCVDRLTERPQRFDLVAARRTLPACGVWIGDEGWSGGEAVDAPFIVTQVPEHFRPDAVLARLAHWRGTP